MATPEEIRLQQENNRLLKEALQTQRQQSDISNGLIDDLKEILGIRTRTTQAEKQTLKVNTDINNAINRQVAGYGTVKSLTADINKNQKAIAKGLNTVKGLEQGLVKTQTRRLQAARTLTKQIKEQTSKVEELEAAMAQGQAVNQNTLRQERQKLGILDNQFGGLLRTLNTQAQQVLLTEQQVDALGEVNQQLEKEKELLEKVEKAFGIFGSVAKALGELPVVGRAFSGAMSNAQGRVAEIAKETGKLPSTLERGGIFAEEFANIIGGLALGYVVQQALALNKAFVETRRVLGLTRNEVSNINRELRDTEAASGNIYTTDQERLATLTQITKTLGFNAQILGKENVAGAARLEQSLGLAADAAGGLATFAALTGTNTMDAARETYNLTKQFNLANKTAFSQQQILEKVGKTSKTIGAFFQFNTRELTKATLQAEKLGLSLEEVNGIASNLLQFESSITAELEAELFLGENINLERARQLALTNKLGELGEELADNEQIRSAFASNNRFAIEATAKALGMSVDQMSKAYYQQELLNLGAQNFKSIYGGVALEQAESLAVQEKFQKSLARLAEAVTPFVELMADLLSNTGLIYTIFGGLALAQIPKLVGGIKSAGVAMRAFGMASKVGLLSTVGTALFANPIGALAAAAALAGTIALVKNATKVEDGIAPSSKGPFTITDSFGATAITAEGDGIAVSPNINQSQGGSTSVDMGPVVAKLEELLSVVKAGGTITIDGQAVGKALTMASYSTGS
jgi:hypothetical protein